jgi:hypothetical protein
LRLAHEVEQFRCLARPLVLVRLACVGIEATHPSSSSSARSLDSRSLQAPETLKDLVHAHAAWMTGRRRVTRGDDKMPDKQIEKAKDRS